MKKKNILFLFTSLVLSSNANASSFSHEFAEGFRRIFESQGHFRISEQLESPNNNYTSYQEGYSEEEALRRAIEESQRTFTQEKKPSVKKTNKPTKGFKKKISKDSRLWFVNELSNAVINEKSLKGLDLLFSLTVDGEIQNENNSFLNLLTREQKKTLFSYKGIGSDATYDEYRDIEQIFKNLYKNFGESNIKESLKENFRYGNSNWDFLNTLYQVEYRKEEINKYFYKQRIEECSDNELLEELENSDNALLNKIAEVITGYDQGKSVYISDPKLEYFDTGFQYINATSKKELTKNECLKYLITALIDDDDSKHKYVKIYDTEITPVKDITGYTPIKIRNILKGLNDSNPVLVKRMFRYLRDQYGYARSIESIDPTPENKKFLDIYNDLSDWKKSLKNMESNEINDEIKKAFNIITNDDLKKDIFDIKKAEILVESFPRKFNNDFVLKLLKSTKFITDDFKKVFDIMRQTNSLKIQFVNKTKLLRLLLNVEGVSKKYILKEILKNSGDSELNIGAILENCKKEDLAEDSKKKLNDIFNKIIIKRQTYIVENYLLSKILDGCKIFDKNEIINLFLVNQFKEGVFFNVKDEKGFWIIPDKTLVDYYKNRNFKEEIKKHIKNYRPWLNNHILEKKEKPQFRNLSSWNIESETAMNIGTSQVLNYMKALFDGGDYKGKSDTEIVDLLIEKLDQSYTTNISQELINLYNELKTAYQGRRIQILKIIYDKKIIDIRNSDSYNKILILSQLVRLKDSHEMDSHERKGILPIVMELVANNKDFEKAFFNSMLAASESNPQYSNPEVCKTTIYLASFFQEVYKDWLSSWTLGGFKRFEEQEEKVLNELLKLTFEIERIVSMLDEADLESVLLQEIGIEELTETLTYNMPTFLTGFSERVQNSKEVCDAPSHLKLTIAQSIETREREAFRDNVIQSLESLIGFCKKVKDDKVLSKAFLTEQDKCFEDFSKLTDAFASDEKVKQSINNIFDNFKKEAERHLNETVSNSINSGKLNKKSILKEYFTNLIKEKTGIENAFDNEQYVYSPLIEMAFEKTSDSLGIKEIKATYSAPKKGKVIKTDLETNVRAEVKTLLQLIEEYPDECKQQGIKVDVNNVISNLSNEFRWKASEDPEKNKEIENILKQLKKEKVY